VYGSEANNTQPKKQRTALLKTNYKDKQRSHTNEEAPSHLESQTDIHENYTIHPIYKVLLSSKIDLAKVIENAPTDDSMDTIKALLAGIPRTYMVMGESTSKFSESNDA
jgi:hypothetical protein